MRFRQFVFARLGAVALALGLAACSMPSVEPPAVSGLPRAVGPVRSGPVYSRTIQTASDTFEMQTGSRVFQRAGSPDIDLVGVVHVAEKDYYRRIQERLGRADLVLYEGITDKDGGAPEMAVEKTAYGRLASSLGLVVQKPGIDYSPKSFRRCDLTIGEMKALLDRDVARGGSDATAARKAHKELANVGTALRGRSWTLNAALGIVRLSPTLQAHMRLMLAGVGSGANEGKGMSKRFQRLIQEDRNQHVIAELQKVIRKEPGHRRVAVFYGAAHMPDFERRLRAMGYQPKRPMVWDSAVHAHPYAAGLSSDEVKKVLGE
ncbi:hypothetical protein OKA04_17790 [Luteolibacter flavescens]|uniref:TraB/GumN family protein n=1 Tax=Luteolibacter flavescens TaxID=1859460 RepID=A0ABT3FSP3_9BACT|nr:hypothetical protein [Luteolibacter flavescens]MCW1886595.1 hypothetical protein [Luteolibacter flavescens]